MSRWKVTKLVMWDVISSEVVSHEYRKCETPSKVCAWSAIARRSLLGPDHLGVPDLGREPHYPHLQRHRVCDRDEKTSLESSSHVSTIVCEDTCARGDR